MSRTTPRRTPLSAFVAQLRKPLRLIAVLATVGLGTAACDVHGLSEPGTLASIVVTPNTTLATAGTQQMVAVGMDAEGRTVTITPTWTIAASGGTVTQTGVFTAGSTTGVFVNTVVASVGAISGSATITVTPGPLATILVVPNPVTLAATATQLFVAVGRDASGNIVQFTPSWTVVAGGGTISQAGLFTASATPGTYTNTVQASSLGRTAFATVVVTVGPLATLTVLPNPATLAVGGIQQFVAVGRDAGGNTVVVAPVWTVTAGGGTIDGAGRFTAGNTPGTFTNTVRASTGTLSATATVVVTAGPLATITVTPNPATMAVGGTQQFTAVGADVGGNPVAITPVWTVVASGGTINATGLFTAGALPGTFTNTVRATSGTVSGTATVVVTTGPLATITVTPNPVFMVAGSTQQFVAVGRDAGGNVFIITPVWSVVAGGGTINTSGLFTAGAVVGAFPNTVQATSGAISGNATVNVTAAPVLTTITVSPNPGTMQTNATQLYTAVGRDQFGVIFPITPVWSVTAGGGTINAGTGLFTAGAVVGTFTNTVRAASGLVAGTATATVTAPPIAPAFLDLGAAAPNGIIAGQAVTCVTGGIINADVSISPGNTLTGFGPCTITGTTNLANGPALAAQNSLTTAYNTLAGLPCPGANAIVANLGGTTLLPGVYCTASGIGVTGVLTLNGNGDPNAVFVFQAGTSLVTAGNIVLINGATARNVYWQVGTSATLGTGSQWQGNILALTSIGFVDAATLNGRALARNGSVTLTTANVITLP